jgi:hypothetical protein
LRRQSSCGWLLPSSPPPPSSTELVWQSRLRYGPRSRSESHPDGNLIFRRISRENLTDPDSIPERFGGVGEGVVGQFQQQAAKRCDLGADARPTSKVTDREMQCSDLLDDRAIRQLMHRASRKRCAQTTKEAVVNRRDDCLRNTSAICKAKSIKESQV